MSLIFSIASSVTAIPATSPKIGCLRLSMPNRTWEVSATDQRRISGGSAAASHPRPGDVIQALLLGAGYAHFPPTVRGGPAIGPDRELALVVDHHVVGAVLVCHRQLEPPHCHE